MLLPVATEDFEPHPSARPLGPALRDLSLSLLVLLVVVGFGLVFV